MSGGFEAEPIGARSGSAGPVDGSSRIPSLPHNTRGRSREKTVASKVGAILLSFTESSEQTLTEISDRVGMPQSTVHRLSGQLVSGGVLHRDDERRYRISDELGFASRSRHIGDCNFENWVSPVLDDLFAATGLQARAGFLESGQVVYFEKCSSDEADCTRSGPRRLPAHATALGKALLAFSPNSTVAFVISRGLAQYTPRTIVRAEHLRQTLRAVRLRRMALCVGEFEQFWSAVAAPVVGVDGWATAAIELRIRDVTRDPQTVGPVLRIAASMLSYWVDISQSRGPGGNCIG